MKKNTLSLLSIVLFSAFFFSCECIDSLDDDNFNDFGSKIEFRLQNSGSGQLSKVMIFLASEASITSAEISLEPGSSTALSLDLASAARVDGAYCISYENNGNAYETSFGYYTNGYPLEESILLDIQDGEIIF